MNSIKSDVIEKEIRDVLRRKDLIVNDTSTNFVVYDNLLLYYDPLYYEIFSSGNKVTVYLKETKERLMILFNYSIAYLTKEVIYISKVDNILFMARKGVYEGKIIVVKANHVNIRSNQGEYHIIDCKDINVECFEAIFDKSSGESVEISIYKRSAVEVISTFYGKIYGYNESRINCITLCKNLYLYDNSFASIKSFHPIFNESLKMSLFLHDFARVYIEDKAPVNIKEQNFYGLITFNQTVFTFKEDTVVYKALDNKRIAELLVKKGQEFQSERNNKCRTTHAYVKSITSLGGKKNFKTGMSSYDNNFIYEVGKEVFPDKYDKEIKECSSGIHFFLKREDAVNYIK